MEGSSVLLVTVDSLRADHLSPYGYRRDTSPKLNRLAGSSWLFEAAYATGPNTHPSFPGTMTSTYPNLFPRGPVSGYLERERTTISEALKNAGYETGGFHSNPFLSSVYGYDRGFDEFNDFLITKRTKSRFDGKDDDIAHFVRRAWDIAVAGKPPFARAEEITGAALGWTSKRKRPFFAWAHFMDVHMPYMPPDGLLETIGSKSIGRMAQISIGRKMTGPKRNRMTTDEVGRAKDLYDASIRYMDSEAGRLIDTVLKSHPDTIVAFTADHGEEFMDHGCMGHGHRLHEELVRVPLLVKLPGGKAKRVAKPVSLADLPVFILEMLGVRIPPSFQGKSLVGRMAGEITEPVFFETLHPVEHSVGLRQGNWKYIHGKEERLFDLASDPGEKEDLRPREAGLVQKFRKEVESHALENGAHRDRLLKLKEAERVKASALKAGGRA